MHICQICIPNVVLKKEYTLHSLNFRIIYLCNSLTNCYLSLILIPVVITLIFNPTAELAIPRGMLINEAEAEIKAHPVIEKTKIGDCSM